MQENTAIFFFKNTELLSEHLNKETFKEDTEEINSLSPENWTDGAQKAIEIIKKIYLFSFKYKKNPFYPKEIIPIESDFCHFINFMEYDYNKLTKSTENIEEKGKIFTQTLISLLTSPEEIKKNSKTPWWLDINNKIIDFNKILCLIKQYSIRIYAEELIQKDSFKKLGEMTKNYTDYWRVFPDLVIRMTVISSIKFKK